MSSFLQQLDEDSRLQAELIGEPGGADDFNIMQTHPRTADRIERAIAEAGATTVADPMRARDVYLSKIDGVLYGDDPEQGFIRDRTFIHPVLRFAFEVPRGFHLFNGARQIVARGPEGGALILFDQEPNPPRAQLWAYLTQGWGRQLRLNDVETFDVDGMEAATGRTRVNTDRGLIDLRLVAIRYDPNTIYRFLFVSHPALTEQLAHDFKETTYTFRKLSQQDVADLEPYTLEIYTVKPGDSVASISERMPFEDLQERRFHVLNGLAPDAELRPGQTVKIITE
jgi:predicted Zn-dependent protease